jgi:hypothetical protein
MPDKVGISISFRGVRPQIPGLLNKRFDDFGRDLRCHPTEHQKFAASVGT